MHGTCRYIPQGDSRVKILAISDISCASHASLTTAVGILTAMGHDVSILPVAILSTQTGGMTGYTYLDLGKEIDGILAHWDSLGLQFDAIYTGYLGNAENIRKITTLVKNAKKKGSIIFVDPVLGDGGELYQGFDNSMIQETAKLAKYADYLLPNATEWALLYADKPISASHTTNIIVTSVQKDDCICNVLASKDGEIYEHHTAYIAGTFHCAGDVFASTFIGYVLNNLDAKAALKQASAFTAKCIRYTAEHNLDSRFGLPYHLFIKEL